MNKHVMALCLYVLGVRASLVSFFKKKENLHAAVLMFAVAFLLVLPDVAHAANPLTVMKDVFREQAESNAFPVIIIWILVFGVITSFFMGKFYPFVLAVFACGVVAIAPEIAPNFNSTNITPSGGW